jgi:hypothetical protein
MAGARRRPDSSIEQFQHQNIKLRDVGAEIVANTTPPPSRPEADVATPPHFFVEHDDALTLNVAHPPCRT